MGLKLLILLGLTDDEQLVAFVYRGANDITA
jgi:hypothetical protein